MITRKTTLVLGAGASHPYGFPLGGELRDRICTSLRGSSDLFSALLSAGYSSDNINEFRKEFAGSLLDSIDLFLGKRPEFREIGKTAIAFEILKCENPGTIGIRRIENDWYTYLWNVLAANHAWDEIASNRLNIITFNYDRSLEYFLYKVMQSAFGKTSGECAEKLKFMEFVHVYGSLGEPAFWSPIGRDYKNTYEPNDLKTVSQSIQVIPEDRKESVGKFKRAFELLKESEVIAFLGFGYDETNLERLGIKRLVHSCVSGNSIQIYGTTLKLRNAEIGRAHKYLGLSDAPARVRHDFQGVDCLELLRELPVIF